MSQRWVCQTWKEQPDNYEKPHVFTENTDDGFCPEQPPYHGILLRESLPVNDLEVSISFPEDKQHFEEGTTITILADTSLGEANAKVEFYVDDKKIAEDLSNPHSHSYLPTKGEHIIHAKVLDSNGASAVSAPVRISVTPSRNPVPEVALCIILMDGSSSMTDAVFKGSPLTRMRLVATTAASGIFDLERMQNNPYAFVAAFKFDDRLELMFIDTIANLIYRYDKDVTKFANYIYDELYKMQQGTDINQALLQAHAFVEKFVKGQLLNFPLKKYRVMMQRILKHGPVESVSIPNVRVLIYTDGMQFDASGNRELHANPFTQKPIEGLNHDIVIGAFFGNEEDEGCRELQSLLSRCPIHDETQFFLFDKPAKIGNLKYLFRMASGASGFCPKCLEKELYR
ncbi:MAG: Ig-like domain-containing protein [Chitinophagaceae bacterium]